jgi:hypothetical protein
MIASTPEQIRQITRDVLARPEFRPTTSWTELLFERLLEWLRELARWSGRNPHLTRVLIIVLSVVLLLLMTHIVYTVVREFSSLRKRDARGAGPRPLRALEGVADNWSDAFKLANTALEAGDMYRSLWITHRVLLSVLDRMGLIKFVRWKTNRDYLSECKTSGEGADTLSALTSAYEHVIYAHGRFDNVYAAQLLARVQELAVKADT